MSGGVELFRGIGEGADDIGHLPVSLGVFVCSHIAGGERPACQINIAGGDLSAVCENRACWDDDAVVSALYRVLHFAPDAAALGPTRNGWSFARTSADAPWQVWSPDAPAPVEFRRRHDA